MGMHLERKRRKQELLNLKINNIKTSQKSIPK